jgi:hypothetical protein
MSSTAASPEAMIDSFPNRHIPKIFGIPTYASINAVKASLAQNAVSISSTRGGGQHGYLGMVLSAPVYHTVTGGQAFALPLNPGNIIAMNTPSAMQVRTHSETLREWREYNNIEQALKKQLADSLDPIYLRAVRDPYVGYNNRSLRELIAHLIQLYGNITPPELKQNDVRFNSPWDPSTPFESLIDQIKTAVEYADAGNQAYTPAQVVNTAFTLVFNTGLYFDECKLWHRQADAPTWQGFKTFFLQATNELRIQQQTAQRAGFHNANAAWGSQEQHHGSEANYNDAQYTEATEALANLATATATDRTTFATMTTTMANLTAQVTTQGVEIAALTKQLAAALAGKNAPRNDRNPTPRIDQGGYCWSHGYLVTATHTGITCKKQKDGHKAAATRQNTMGGSTFGKPP